MTFCDGTACDPPHATLRVQSSWGPGTESVTRSGFLPPHATVSCPRTSRCHVGSALQPSFCAASSSNWWSAGAAAQHRARCRGSAAAAAPAAAALARRRLPPSPPHQPLQRQPPEPLGESPLIRPLRCPMCACPRRRSTTCGAATCQAKRPTRRLPQQPSSLGRPAPATLCTSPFRGGATAKRSRSSR